MISSTGSSRKLRHSLLSVALGSTALLSPLCAHAGFELTPAQTPAKNASPSESGAPLPMYEGLKPVVSSPLPSPLDMSPPEKAAPASVPAENAGAIPAAAGETGALAPDEMLPVPPAMKRVNAEGKTPGASAAAVNPVEAQKMTPPPNVPEHPSLTGPVVPTAQNFVTIDGFGRDVPLALAMRQIVPPDYAFSFGDGADPGQRVSWSGGAPWNAVLQKAVESSGLAVEIDGKTVVVAARGKGEIAPPPAMTQPPARQLRENIPANSGAAMTPMPQMAGEPSGAPVSLAPVAAAGPAPSIEETARPGEPLSSPASPAPARIAPFMKAPAMAQSSAPPKKGVDTESLLPPLSAAGGREPPPLSAPENGIAPGEKTAFAPSVPIVETRPDAGAVPAYPRNFDASAVKDWTADSGSTLRHILAEWSREAGVQLYWSSEYDYPIQADVMLNGTYEKAVATLLDGLRDAQPRPLGRLHPNPPDGPAVLIIETRHILN